VGSGRGRQRERKALHKWGQAEALQYEPIDAFCPPDGLILDPFCGAGTNLIAARDFGRRAIGIEIDERCCEIAANRLGQGILFSGGVA
jgi:site-specific DNA-methyltransferase (adenine-specific)